MSKVYLKRGRDSSVKRFHPWVYSGAIASIEGNPASGELVELYSHQNEFLGCGHYNNGTIAIRLLAFDSTPLQKEFWLKRVGEAMAARSSLLLPTEGQTNAFRLVHGEGDMLPGLILDYYNGVVVMQTHSTGMFLERPKIVEALKELFGENLKGVYDKSSNTLPSTQVESPQDGYIYNRANGTTVEDTILENGLSFKVDWVGGQKTGFFLDQRENRLSVKNFSKGRRVLNLFCYTGGFSIYAMAGGALSVDSVDSSERAIELCKVNYELNKVVAPDCKFELYCTDAMEFLKNSPQGAYDLMVIDPPAFAKHRDALKNALRAYTRLNQNAISKIAPGGIIFSFSCSQIVDKESFGEALFTAATLANRRVRIIGRMTQPADHPVNIFHPEGEYLKGLILQVD